MIKGWLAKRDAKRRAVLYGPFPVMVVPVEALLRVFRDVKASRVSLVEVLENDG